MENRKMRECKACGEQIAKSAKICPNCGARQGRKVLPIVIAVVVILVLISVISGTSSEPELVDNVDTNSPDPVETEEQEESVFGVGDIVALNDVHVTLLSVTENSGANYISPDDGNVFVLFEFDIDNQSDSSVTVSSLLSFTAYFDDYAQSLSFSAIVASDLSQLDGTVDAGKKMTGVVGYEVSADWAVAEIRFTPDFWSGQEIIFVYTKGASS